MTHAVTIRSLPVLSDAGLSRYLDEVKRFPMLTDEEEYIYARALHDHGDRAAAEKLVTSHLRLVVKIAMGFRGYGLPLADVIAEGNIGLMQAVKRFDPEKGFRLATYAMWWIKAQIQEYVLRSWSLVKIGTTAAQKTLFFNLRKMKQKIASAGAHPSDRHLSNEDAAQIAKDLSVTVDEVMEMDRRLSGPDSSLNVMAFDEGEDEKIAFLEDENANHELAISEREDADYKRRLFYEAMKSLNEREQLIVRERQLKDPAATLEELSQKLSVSRERVRQIESRALEKLQQNVLKALAAPAQPKLLSSEPR